MPLLAPAEPFAGLSAQTRAKKAYAPAFRCCCSAILIPYRTFALSQISFNVNTTLVTFAVARTRLKSPLSQNFRKRVRQCESELLRMRFTNRRGFPPIFFFGARKKLRNRGPAEHHKAEFSHPGYFCLARLQDYELHCRTGPRQLRDPRFSRVLAVPF